MAANGKTIMVVDDEPDIRATVSKILELQGYEVVMAESGKDAMDRLHRMKPPALVLLDVMMPDMNGYQTLSCIRDEGMDVPVVMLTAKAAEEDIIKGYGVGADYYITKPFSNKTLLNIASYLLDDLSDDERKELEVRL